MDSDSKPPSTTDHVGNREDKPGNGDAPASISDVGSAPEVSQPAATAPPSGESPAGQSVSKKSTKPAQDSGKAGTAAASAGGNGAKKAKPPEGNSSRQPVVPAKKRRSGFKLIVILLLLAGLAVGTFYGWSQYGETLQDRFFAKTPVVPITTLSTPQAPQAQPAADESAASVIAEDDGDYAITEAEAPGAAVDSGLQQQLSQQALTIERLEAQVADTRIQLDSQQARLQQLSTSSRVDWQLAEAEYLLRLASQRLLTERQTANAIALMTTADGILRDIDDPALFAVRKVLAADITQIKMAGVVDREGLYLRLDALINAIPELQASQQDKTPAAPAVAAPEPQQTWYRKLAENAWAALVKMSGIVRVERVDIPLEPVLLPSEQQLLQLNLRLALEQAQLALMREEQQIYSASLQRASAYLDDRFAASAASEVFKTELNALAAQQVVSPLPGLDKAIKALQDYINIWHNSYQAGEQESSGQQELSQPVEAQTGDEQ